LPAYLTRTAEAQRREWSAYYRSLGQPAVADALSDARLVWPNALVNDRIEVNIGGRRVAFHHFGPAHTDHDLVVHVPDVGLVFAGDLVEQGAPPSVGSDSEAGHWPVVLDRLLELRPRIIVPGHGDPVDTEFVARQRRELAAYSG
jgi:glyoxylase-like metal-dependent hydrolase (beta-lactamase superfamily II)